MGVPIVAQWKGIRLGTMRLRVQSLALLSGLRIRYCHVHRHGIGHRHGSDPVLLYLWCRLTPTAPIGPLAWKPPYASGAALKKDKRKNFFLEISGFLHLFLTEQC